jgi:hypothetical protein
VLSRSAVFYSSPRGRKALKKTDTRNRQLMLCNQAHRFNAEN